MIEMNCADNPIPLSNITGKILAGIVEFCSKHAEAGVDAESLRAWDAEFVAVDQAPLFDYLEAANFLEIPALLDLSCRTVADRIKVVTPQGIRKIFNIKSDFTPEEEVELRRQKQWEFE